MFFATFFFDSVQRHHASYFQTNYIVYDLGKKKKKREREGGINEPGSPSPREYTAGL